MKLYLSPAPSLELTRYLRSTNGEDGLMGRPLRRRVLTDAINATRSLQELDETAQRWLKHVSHPVHALVVHGSKGTSTKQLVTHAHQDAMPHETLLDLGHDVCICAPHFTFVQLTTQVDLIDAVLIGMELCGTYSKWHLEPDRMGDPYYLEHAETQACTFNLPPAMRLKRLEGFVGRQPGIRGAVGARSALR